MKSNWIFFQRYLLLYIVLQKKKKKKRAHKYKTIQKLCFLFIYLFLWFTYIRLLVFYTQLTHLVQKLNKKKLRLDGTHVAKLNSN